MGRGGGKRNEEGKEGKEGKGKRREKQNLHYQVNEVSTTEPQTSKDNRGNSGTLCMETQLTGNETSFKDKTNKTPKPLAQVSELLSRLADTVQLLHNSDSSVCLSV